MPFKSASDCWASSASFAPSRAGAEHIAQWFRAAHINFNVNGVGSTNLVP
jgi:hypothetical protein